MVQCPSGHTLRSCKVKNSDGCKSCSAPLVDGTTSHRCGPCDFDLCAGCMAVQATAAKAELKSNDGVKNKFVKDRKPRGVDHDPGDEDASLVPKGILKGSPSRQPFLAGARSATFPALPSFPGMVAAVDVVNAGQNSVLAAQGLSPLTSFASSSPAPAVAAALPAAPEGVPASMWIAMGQMFDVKLAPVHETLQNLHHSVTDLQTNAVHKSQFEAMGKRVTFLEETKETEHDRVGRLEKTVDELKERLRTMKIKDSGTDDSYRRIVFLGLPKLLYDERVKAMKDFMQKNFPEIDATCSVFYSGSFKEGTRVMTDTGFAQFVSSDVRKFVLDKIEDKNLKFNMKSKNVQIQRARSKAASDRNKALRLAADALKKLVEDEDDIVIQWGHDGRERGVTVRGVYAYDQPSGDSRGSFVGDFEHLEL